MSKTSIQWTDYSWNPLRAWIVGDESDDGPTGHYCEKVSPGCALCYASRMQPRFRMPFFPGQRTQEQRDAGDVGVYLDEKRLNEPTTWRGPLKVFVCDMSDLFGEWVKDEWLNRIFTMMEQACDRHGVRPTYQILTKRPERMAKYLGWRWGEGRIPARNIWLGVSAENQEYADQRIPKLLATPAAVRFVSAEPLLGPIDFLKDNGLAGWDYLRGWNPHAGPEGANTSRIDWVIIGGESGPRARPCNVAWVRSLVEQCRAAEVPAFVKQLGTSPYLDQGEQIRWVNAGLCDSGRRDPKGGDPSEWPADLRVRQFPNATEVSHA